jgi:hypothetical protein
MTTTLKLPDELVREIESRVVRENSNVNDAIAALLRIGLANTAPASSTLDESMLERRRALTQMFVSGDLGVELANYEKARGFGVEKSLLFEQITISGPPAHSPRRGRQRSA